MKKCCLTCKHCTSLFRWDDESQCLQFAYYRRDCSSVVCVHSAYEYGSYAVEMTRECADEETDYECWEVDPFLEELERQKEEEAKAND